MVLSKDELGSQVQSPWSDKIRKKRDSKWKWFWIKRLVKNDDYEYKYFGARQCQKLVDKSLTSLSTLKMGSQCSEGGRDKCSIYTCSQSRNNKIDPRNESRAERLNKRKIAVHQFSSVSLQLGLNIKQKQKEKSSQGTAQTKLRVKNEIKESCMPFTLQ